MSSTEMARECAVNSFKKEIKQRGYGSDTIEEATKLNKNFSTSQQNGNRTRVSRHWLWFPYVNEKTDR